MLKDAAEEGSQTALAVANIIFDNMYRMSHQPTKAVAAAYCKALSELTPHDAIRIQRVSLHPLPYGSISTCHRIQFYATQPRVVQIVAERACCHPSF